MAWTVILDLFGLLYPSTVKSLGPLPWLHRRRLSALRRALFAGLEQGRSASGMRPGLEGRKLAIDPRLMPLASAALGGVHGREPLLAGEHVALLSVRAHC